MNIASDDIKTSQESCYSEQFPNAGRHNTKCSFTGESARFRGCHCENEGAITPGRPQSAWSYGFIHTFCKKHSPFPRSHAVISRTREGMVYGWGFWPTISSRSSRLTNGGLVIVHLVSCRLSRSKAISISRFYSKSYD